MEPSIGGKLPKNLETIALLNKGGPVAASLRRLFSHLISCFREQGGAKLRVIETEKGIRYIRSKIFDFSRVGSSGD